MSSSLLLSAMARHRHCPNKSAEEAILLYGVIISCFWHALNSAMCDGTFDLINSFEVSKLLVSNKNQWFAWWIPFMCMLKLLGKFLFHEKLTRKTHFLCQTLFISYDKCNSVKWLEFLFTVHCYMSTKKNVWADVSVIPVYLN